jgi:hypothetical protein
MSTLVQTHDMVAKIAAATLTNQAVGKNVVNMDYEAEFKPSGKGDTLRVKIPARFISYASRDLTGVDQYASETYMNLTLDTEGVVPVTYTDKDLTLEISNFNEQIAKPMVEPVADDFDTFIFDKMGWSCPNIVGEPGITPSSDEVITNATVRLAENGCPLTGLNAVFNHRAAGNIAQYLKATSNQQIAADVIKRGYAGKDIAGTRFWQSNNVYRHTNGSFDGTPIVKGASQGADGTIIIDGIGGAYTGFLKKGDILTFAGCYAVRPTNHVALPHLKQFVVTKDVDSVADNTGEATVSISPAIVTSGAKQNCSAYPTNDGAVKLFGSAGQTYTRNLVCHPGAFTFATSPLHPLTGGSVSHPSGVVEGMSVLLTIFDEGRKMQTIRRLDYLYGGLMVNPDMCCLVAGESTDE